MRFRFALCALLTLPMVGCVREGAPGESEPVRLVSGGRFRGRIYHAAAADARELEAARHLARWIRRVTGAAPEIAIEPPGEPLAGIYVGATRAAARAGIAPPASPSGETAVRAARHGRTVFLVGATPLATRLAAGVFSREVLGVAFTAPGLIGADWEPRSEVVVSGGDARWRPTYAWRAITLGNHPAENEWALDNGFGALPAMNHNLHAIFDAEAYARHPEVFPVIGGVRRGPSGRGGYEPQPNLAHPESVRLVVDAVVARLAAEPATPAFSLSINDTSAWDESPMSVAAYGPERWFRTRRNRTDYVFRFMNAVAEGLDARGAGPVRLTGYAYYECEAPPSFPLHPRVFPILTADRSEWRDPAFAREDAAVIDAWARSGCSGFGIYDYHYGREMVMPRVFSRAQAASIRHAAKAGASLFYGETTPDWGFDAPKVWLTARLTEDAGADPTRLLDDFYARAYGPAADAMRRFYDGVERRWSDRPQPPRWIRFYRDESAAVLFPAEVRRALTRALDEARAASPESACADARAWRRRCRVLAAALAWARADAFADWYEARAALAAAPEAADDAGVARIAALHARCERLRLAYATACDRWARSPLNPGTPFDPARIFGAQIEGMAALKCAGRVTADAFLPEAQVRAVAPAGPAEVLCRESFESDTYPASPANGVAPGLREVVTPEPPSYGKATPAEGMRFGPDTTRAKSGRRSLLVAGSDNAGFARRFAVRPGDTIGATVACSGKVTAGEHVAVYLQFRTFSGGRAGEVLRGVAFPGGDDSWRMLAAVGAAPADAAYADVTLRVTAQDAGDAVWFDDLCVRRVPAP